jgi:hypothetical protein
VASTTLATQPVSKGNKNTKTKTRATAEARTTKSKGSASPRAPRPAKPYNKRHTGTAASPAATNDDRAGSIFPAEQAGIDDIVAILDGAQATHKVNWMSTSTGTKYIKCIWFDLVTQDTMAELSASVGLITFFFWSPAPPPPFSLLVPVRDIDQQTDVKRALFYKEEERMRQQGIGDLVEGRGWFQQEEYDSDL